LRTVWIGYTAERSGQQQAVRYPDRRKIAGPQCQGGSAPPADNRRAGCKEASARANAGAAAVTGPKVAVGTLLTPHPARARARDEQRTPVPPDPTFSRMRVVAQSLANHERDLPWRPSQVGPTGKSTRPIVRTVRTAAFRPFSARRQGLYGSDVVVSRDRLVLVDSDLCPTLACPGQVFDPAVNDGANAFQELDSGIREVFAYLGRQAQVLPDLLQDFAAQAALVNGRLARILLSRFLFAHCASFSSTVRTRLSSRARTGTNVAIERGKPM